MHPDAPYFSILLCLTPSDFIRQLESAATQRQWVNGHSGQLWKWSLSTYSLTCSFTVHSFTVIIYVYCMPGMVKCFQYVIY
jgi:hypothetical protein